MSPSQLETWLSCQRKWAWKYIAKAPDPSHPSAAKGVKIHSLLEKYLSDGETLPLSSPDPHERECAQIALSGLEHLPAPQTEGVVLESGFKFVSSRGHRWRGFRDILVYPFANGGVPHVWDHKTRSDLRWALNEHSLSYDVQAIVYAKSALIEWPESSHVDLTWLYYQTRGPRKTRRVHLRLTKEHVNVEFSKIDGTAAQPVSRLLASADPLSLPPTPEACGKYGGCPFRGLCTDLSSSQGMRSFMQSNTNTSNADDLLAELMGNSPPPTPKVETVSDGRWVFDRRTGAIIDEREFKTDATTAAMQQEFAKFMQSAPEDIVKRIQFARQATVKVNPPEGDNSPIPLPEELEPPKKARKPRQKKAAPAEEPFPLEEKIKDDVPVAAEGFDLYIDAMPKNVATMPLANLLDIARERISNIPDEKGVKHPDYRFFPFGKGAGVLALVMRELIDEGQVLGAITMSSRMPEAQVVQSVLESRARTVVVGVK